jgi:hypothetical protein
LLEIGIKPEATFEKLVFGKDFIVGFPVRTTFGFNDYYGVDAGSDWGYLGFGPTLAVPVTKNLTLTAGIDFLVLGDETRNFVPNRDSLQTVGSIGLVFKF